MSYELKTNTAVRIPVGPLVDPTDGKTAETALDVTALLIQIYQMKTDGSAVVRTAVTPTASGGSNDMALVTSSTDGMYDLEVTAAQINFLGNGRISFYDVDGFLVHYFDIHVVSANYFNNKYGSTVEDVNIASTDDIDFSATQIATINTQADTALSDINLDSLIPASGVVEAAGPNSSTQVQTDLAEATNDHYNGMGILFTSGDEAGQARVIDDYVGATGTISWTRALTGEPASSVTFILLPNPLSIADVWDRVLTGATHNIASSAGRRLRTLGSNAIFTGTASAGSADSITLAGGSTTNGIYVGTGINIIGGTGEGQSRYIVSYDGGTKIAEVARAWTTAPSSDSEFVITPDHQIDFIEMGVAQAGGATSITLASTANAVNNTFTGTLIRIMSGTGDDQVRLITDYDGTTKVATVSPAWETNPDSTSSYATLNMGTVNVQTVARTVQTANDNGADINAILTDTNEIQGKLPTNKFMGSSDGADDDGNIAAILTDTADIQPKIGSPAADVSADIAAVKSDTAAILVDTGTTLDGRIPAALVGGRMDSNVSAINNVNQSAINLERSASVIVTGTAQTGTLSTTQMSTDLSETTDDHYNGRIIIWTSGVLIGQATDITDYVGVNGVCTFTATTEAPSNNDTFVIV